MIQRQVIQRTHPLKKGSTEATSIVVDVDLKQYLLTSNEMNLFQGELEIFTGGDRFGWEVLEVNLVGSNDGLCVLAASKLLAQPDRALEMTSIGVDWGQVVYYAGFPAGIAVPELKLDEDQNSPATTIPHV